MANVFFTKEDTKKIVEAIKTAELETSGEIQVHVDKKCKGEVLDRAADVFAALKMHKTKDRNGVLFYLATDDHKFAIIGDVGINIKVPENFWNDIKENMRSYFKEGRFSQGLAEGIITAGLELKKYFPRAIDDVNELPDEISFGNQ